MNDVVKNAATETANQTFNFEKEMMATKNEVARLSAQIAAAVTTLGEIAKLRLNAAPGKPGTMSTRWCPPLRMALASWRTRPRRRRGRSRMRWQA